MTIDNAYFTISKHIYFAQVSVYREFDPVVILANSKKDAAYIAKERYGWTSPYLWEATATDNPQIFEIGKGENIKI